MSSGLGGSRSLEQSRALLYHRVRRPVGPVRPRGRTGVGGQSDRRPRARWLKAESEEARGTFKTKGFWLGKYEVTQAQWTAVMGENPSHYDGKRQNAVKGMDLTNCPVDSVNWNTCQKFLGAVN